MASQQSLCSREYTGHFQPGQERRSFVVIDRLFDQVTNNAIEIEYMNACEAKSLSIEFIIRIAV